MASNNSRAKQEQLRKRRNNLLRCHNDFWLLKTVISVGFHQVQVKNDKLRRVVSDIRHAAVHRIMQDRSGFYQKLDAAAEFAGLIGGGQWARMLAHLQKAITTFLTKMDDRFLQLKDNIQ
ncbi:hypothetical protein N7539_008521 [Penicillium diatomitis]|uniref:Uncharacterized protein n=1 Tax=Penicillium diatomitis TaxID=2819901 RepID=A0A9X0BM48_9EURO|nr:uncharacterized protein N7539_008521 [Penicillium diatomitis]KAJ5471952.1 hypothetical protein N7539_008521 [Penicillium diatomitis]